MEACSKLSSEFEDKLETFGRMKRFAENFFRVIHVSPNYVNTLSTSQRLLLRRLAQHISRLFSISVKMKKDSIGKQEMKEGFKNLSIRVRLYVISYYEFEIKETTRIFDYYGYFKSEPTRTLFEVFLSVTHPNLIDAKNGRFLLDSLPRSSLFSRFRIQLKYASSEISPSQHLPNFDYEGVDVDSLNIQIIRKYISLAKDISCVGKNTFLTRLNDGCLKRLERLSLLKSIFEADRHTNDYNLNSINFLSSLSKCVKLKSLEFGILPYINGLSKTLGSLSNLKILIISKIGSTLPPSMDHILVTPSQNKIKEAYTNWIYEIIIECRHLTTLKFLAFIPLFNFAQIDQIFQRCHNLRNVDLRSPSIPRRFTNDNINDDNDDIPQFPNDLYAYFLFGKKLRKFHFFNTSIPALSPPSSERWKRLIEWDVQNSFLFSENSNDEDDSNNNIYLQKLRHTKNQNKRVYFSSKMQSLKFYHPFLPSPLFEHICFNYREELQELRISLPDTNAIFPLLDFFIQINKSDKSSSSDYVFKNLRIFEILFGPTKVDDIWMRFIETMFPALENLIIRTEISTELWPNLFFNLPKLRHLVISKIDPNVLKDYCFEEKDMFSNPSDLEYKQKRMDKKKKRLIRLQSFVCLIPLNLPWFLFHELIRSCPNLENIQLFQSYGRSRWSVFPDVRTGDFVEFQQQQKKLQQKQELKKRKMENITLFLYNNVKSGCSKLYISRKNKMFQNFVISSTSYNNNNNNRTKKTDHLSSYIHQKDFSKLSSSMTDNNNIFSLYNNDVYTNLFFWDKMSDCITERRILGEFDDDNNNKEEEEDLNLLLPMERFITIEMFDRIENMILEVLYDDQKIEKKQSSSSLISSNIRIVDTIFRTQSKQQVSRRLMLIDFLSRNGYLRSCLSFCLSLSNEMKKKILYEYYLYRPSKTTSDNNNNNNQGVGEVITKFYKDLFGYFVSNNNNNSTRKREIFQVFGCLSFGEFKNISVRRNSIFMDNILEFLPYLPSSSSKTTKTNIETSSSSSSKICGMSIGLQFDYLEFVNILFPCDIFNLVSFGSPRILITDFRKMNNDYNNNKKNSMKTLKMNEISKLAIQIQEESVVGIRRIKMEFPNVESILQKSKLVMMNCFWRLEIIKFQSLRVSEDFMKDFVAVTPRLRRLSLITCGMDKDLLKVIVDDSNYWSGLESFEIVEYIRSTLEWNQLVRLLKIKYPKKNCVIIKNISFQEFSKM